MQLGFTIKHHDLEYVDKRGGVELLTHLRSADARVRYRRAAIERAWALFTTEDSSASEHERLGRGLIVLQRALLAVEDLGGLLHALAGDEPWVRLRTTHIDDLDAAFTACAREPEPAAEELFRLPTLEEIDADAPSPEVGRGLRELRRRSLLRWSGAIGRSAEAWLRHRDVAKATMHGFPMVAGRFITEPPGAGVLGKAVPRTKDPFAVALLGTKRGTTLQTEPRPVLLSNTAVAGYRRAGIGAARLAGELCEAQAFTIMSGTRAAVPFRFLDKLPDPERAALEAEAERQEAETQ